MDFGSFFAQLKKEDDEKQRSLEKQDTELYREEFAMVCNRILEARKKGVKCVDIPRISNPTLIELKKHVQKMEPCWAMNPSTHDNYVIGHTVFFN